MSIYIYKIKSNLVFPWPYNFYLHNSFDITDIKIWKFRFDRLDWTFLIVLFLCYNVPFYLNLYCGPAVTNRLCIYILKHQY